MTWDYKEVIGSVIRLPTGDQRGLEIEEIRSSLKVLDALDKAGDYLNLEDADFYFMADKIKAAKYTFVSPVIVQFVDDVTNPESEE